MNPPSPVRVAPVNGGRQAANPMDPKPVVLGAELAAALAVERARLASHAPGSSPLSGRLYDHERQEFDLSAVAPVPLDVEVGSLVRAWLHSGADEREVVRRHLSLEDNYTLIQFAKRMAVQALNQSSSEACEHGLMALAMIDESRIDPRDASWAAGLLNHTARAQPDRLKNLFERAIAVATPGIGKLLRQAEGSTLEDWGYRERRTINGIGLIRSGWARYDPTLDLADVALQIGAKVLTSRYVVEIEVATQLPSVWFETSTRTHAEEMLGRSLGVVAISGTLRQAFGESLDQMFVTWIAEMPSPNDCVELVANVGSGEAHEGRQVVGVSAGRLFALLVAGSVQQGVEPYESRAALMGLAERTRGALSELAE